MSNYPIQPTTETVCRKVSSCTYRKNPMDSRQS